MERLVALTVVLLLLGIAVGLPVEPSSGQPVLWKISGVTVRNVSEHSFEVEWQTDERALGGIEWGTTKKYGHVTEEPGSNLLMEHTLNVTGLKRGTLYHFRIFATDFANNTVYSKDFEVGTHPYEEEGSSSVVWAVVGVLGLVLLVYLVFIRPRTAG